MKFSSLHIIFYFIIMFFVFLTLRYIYNRIEKSNPSYLIYYKLLICALVYITINVIALKFDFFYIILAIQGLYILTFFENLFTWRKRYSKFKSDEKKSFCNKIIIHLKIFKMIVIDEVKNIDSKFIEAREVFYNDWSKYKPGK